MSASEPPWMDSRRPAKDPGDSGHAFFEAAGRARTCPRLWARGNVRATPLIEITRQRPWPTSPARSACRSVRTSAGRSATKRSCAGSSSRFPVEGDTLSLRGQPRDDRAVRPAPAGALRPRHRPAHALVPHQPRVDQEGGRAQRPVRLQQSLVDPGEREAHDLLRDDAPRPARCPETWMVPPKAYEQDARICESDAASATRASSISARSARSSAIRSS